MFYGAALATIVAAIGLAALPYGYYTFLRLVLCACCGVGVYRSVRMKSAAWPWVYGAACLLYNPIFPVHLGRGTKGIWIALNAATVALLWIGAVRLRTRPMNEARPPGTGAPSL